MSEQSFSSVIDREFWVSGAVSVISGANHLRDVTEYDVTRLLELSDPERRRIDNHSFDAIFSSLGGQMYFLANELWDPEFLGAIRGRFDRMIAAGREYGEYIYADWTGFKEDLFREMDAWVDVSTLSTDRQWICARYQEAFNKIFAILEDRIAEFKMWRQRESDDIFLEFSAHEIRMDMRKALQAMASGSRWRFGVVFDIEQKTERDYLVLLDISHEDDGALDSVSFPMVFRDIFRDLLANARKYSPYGSIIYGRIHETRAHVKFVVIDQWYGIPESAIEKVGTPGLRFKNVTEKGISWHGYGMTKAIRYAQQFGGSVTIRSQEGVGTEVTVIIPKKFSIAA